MEWTCKECPGNGCYYDDGGGHIHPPRWCPQSFPKESGDNGKLETSWCKVEKEDMDLSMWPASTRARVREVLRLGREMVKGSNAR